MKGLILFVMSLCAAVAYGRAIPTYGILVAQVPTSWPMNAPATGGYCVLYANGAEVLGVDADANGICYFGYVKGFITYDVVGYEMTNYDSTQTGATAQGEIRLTVPCNCKHVLTLTP